MNTKKENKEEKMSTIDMIFGTLKFGAAIVMGYYAIQLLFS